MEIFSSVLGRCCVYGVCFLFVKIEVKLVAYIFWTAHVQLLSRLRVSDITYSSVFFFLYLAMFGF